FRYLALTFTEEQVMPDVIKNVIGEIESDIASQQGTEGEQHVALEFESVQVSPTETGATQTAGAVSTEGSTYQYQDDAPICPTCGSITVRSGACYVCTHCGSSSGCG
ncbi:MAG: hypothetical protein F4183_02495, partial [Rhodothermaceae bacterium]|nr:hypothetical protein [Rhodothermaceae bacterium]